MNKEVLNNSKKGLTDEEKEELLKKVITNLEKDISILEKVINNDKLKFFGNTLVISTPLSRNENFKTELKFDKEPLSKKDVLESLKEEADVDKETLLSAVVDGIKSSIEGNTTFEIYDNFIGDLETMRFESDSLTFLNDFDFLKGITALDKINEVIYYLKKDPLTTRTNKDGKDFYMFEILQQIKLETEIIGGKTYGVVDGKKIAFATNNPSNGFKHNTLYEFLSTKSSYFLARSISNVEENVFKIDNIADNLDEKGRKNLSEILEVYNRFTEYFYKDNGAFVEEEVAKLINSVAIPTMTSRDSGDNLLYAFLKGNTLLSYLNGTIDKKEVTDESTGTKKVYDNYPIHFSLANLFTPFLGASLGASLREDDNFTETNFNEYLNALKKLDALIAMMHANYLFYNVKDTKSSKENTKNTLILSLNSTNGDDYEFFNKIKENVKTKKALFGNYLQVLEPKTSTNRGTTKVISGVNSLLKSNEKGEVSLNKYRLFKLPELNDRKIVYNYNTTIEFQSIMYWLYLTTNNEFNKTDKANKTDDYSFTLKSDKEVRFRGNTKKGVLTIYDITGKEVSDSVNESLKGIIEAKLKEIKQLENNDKNYYQQGTLQDGIYSLYIPRINKSGKILNSGAYSLKSVEDKVVKVEEIILENEEKAVIESNTSEVENTKTELISILNNILKKNPKERMLLPLFKSDISTLGAASHFSKLKRATEKEIRDMIEAYQCQ